MKHFFLVALLIFSVLALGAKERSGERHDVSIENLQFKPPEISIKRGDTVVWTNNDDRDHTVISKDGSFRSGNIKSGKTFEYTFTKAGRFVYGCTYHPRMGGVVIVGGE